MTAHKHRHSHVHTHHAAPHHAHAAKHHTHVTPVYVTAFFAAHAAEARAVGMKYGLPASAILAQSALESTWGTNAPGNAFFGIKGKAPSGKSVQTATHEVIKGQKIAETDAFRAYDNWAEAADDYANLITTHKAYSTVLPYRNDGLKYAEAMGHTPYATGPGYGAKMKSIIQSHNLTQYDK